MKTIHLYFRVPPQGYKIIPGDRYVVNFIRRVLGKSRVSGVEKVFLNLCKSLDQLNIKYSVNQPFTSISPTDPVVVLGAGKYSLEGYKQSNPIIAGIGLMTHPSEWPGLFNEYPVAKYLQHSIWAKNIYAPYFGKDNCALWPAGIDTVKWAPTNNPKKIDILVYNKIRWNNEEINGALRNPILKRLDELGISYKEIVYGNYFEQEYFSLLQQCRAMIFLCEHESQGFACCEAMAMDVPVFAWNQGFCLDPNRFSWGETDIPASSVPFFDDICGTTFKNLQEFKAHFPVFWERVKANAFSPRNFIEANLSLKKSAERMLDIINSVYS